ncbi:MAG: hypothetical protein ABI678_11740 [Kofleriaceae bacterium]
MRTGIAFAVAALAGCGSSAVDMSLVVPADTAEFDLTCVTAVDVLPLATTDKMPIEFADRTDDFPCIAITTPVDKFTKLAAAMANKVDIPLPAGGLGAVAVRGRRGTCEENPAKYEAVFYGGAAYKPGDTELRIPLARSLSCGDTQSFTVKPVEMIKLFTGAHTCADYVDPNSQVFSGDLRPTLVPAHPSAFERGASSAPMSAATAMVDSYKAAYKGTCAAIGLENTDNTIAGLTCINAGVPSACGAGAFELALVPTGYTFDPTLSGKYSGATIIGVWSAKTPIGPLSDATITIDDGADAKVVFGALASTGFTAGTGTMTDATGGAIVYANGVVGITVTSDGMPRKLTVGGAPGKPSAIIAVFN